MSDNNLAGLPENNEDYEESLFENLLESVLYRIGCPEVSVLHQFKLGLLTEDEAATVQEHLALCRYCVADLASLPDKTEVISFQGPPLLYPTYRPAAQQVRGHDSYKHEMNLIGDMKFELKDPAIGLLIQWTHDEQGLFVLEGELLSDDQEILTQSKVELIHVDEQGNLTRINDLNVVNGLFEFQQVKVGVYAIKIETPQGDIPIPDIKLGVP